ncbi:MAG TPA: metallophosphoesterase family protein [Acidimicrobiales bacterium]
MAAAALVGAAAALLALGPLGHTKATVGPGTVEVSAGLAFDGATVVALPPLGRVEASTHRTPVSLTAQVLAVDVEAAQQTTTATDPVGALRREVDAALPGLLRRFAVRATLIALAGGAIGALLLPGRRWWDPLVGAGAGLLAVGGLLGATWSTYDIDAFGEPSLSGELQRAPGLLRAVERNLEGINQVRDRVDAISTRLAELYAASVDELPGGAAGETAILHVSDLHLNPLGAELAVQLAGDMQVDAVLDTGDVTTFGLPLESRFGSLLQASPVPYIVVPGNHDSPANRAQLSQMEGITVLDGDSVTVGGVRILGIADPSFTASNEVSTNEANELKASLTDEVRVEVLTESPDVLAVHDPAQAAAATGLVPVVAAGHTHKTSTEVVDGTWVLTIGSTGATGLGSFAIETKRPYEAQVLRFSDGRLVAIDYISMTGIDGAFSLERRLVPQNEVEPDPDRVLLGVPTTSATGTTTTTTAPAAAVP